MHEDLRGKTITLGVTGGIAAYKAVEIASHLVKLGADVDVIMTDAATRFVSRLTFEAITHRTVYMDMWEHHTLEPHHIALAERADLFVLAPATANTLAKMANGLADNLLTSVLLATQAPLVIAPAMNDGMWAHPATQANVERLQAWGATFIGPEEGRLASGKTGRGRMSDPDAIVNTILLRLRELAP